MKHLAALLMLVLLAACGTKTPSQGTEAQITALAATIRNMSPLVDPAEASRAAHVAYSATYQLARAYQITDPALVHNAKVNAGKKPRGLCYHWAEDMQALLDAEGFTTIGTARAIANTGKNYFIEHSTVVITVKGAPMKTGIVVDPWRYAGTLFWAPVREDTRYAWKLREDVLRARGQIRYIQRTVGALAPPPTE